MNETISYSTEPRPCLERGQMVLSMDVAPTLTKAHSADLCVIAETAGSTVGKTPICVWAAALLRSEAKQ
jgi:hypothetical protein